MSNPKGYFNPIASKKVEGFKIYGNKDKQVQFIYNPRVKTEQCEPKY